MERITKSVKKDVKRFIKKRAKERKEDLDNPIEGIFEDIKIVGEKVFGGTALDIAIKKIITADGVIKLVELSERKKIKKLIMIKKIFYQIKKIKRNYLI